jgi:hypothetical protein
VKWERNFHTFSAMLTEVQHAAAAHLAELGYGRIRIGQLRRMGRGTDTDVVFQQGALIRQKRDGKCIPPDLRVEVEVRVHVAKFNQSTFHCKLLTPIEN